ncbi:hypothetical protein GCM10023193_17520 [Planotetraspora kaengkrachanensis]|uniref:Uncharacterized protein n=1 Tax=Planotetraspora kaengkrachanensis TaxID=575193 RepID=A0A8J3PRG2_9ACTN|nr:hypothetical protein Pka01_28980 [Planotetraspora kaengkrachanensis]
MIAHSRLGERVQVLSRVGTEPEGLRQRGEHLSRRVVVPPLLQPRIVVGAQAGQPRDLLAAQPGRPATVARTRQPHLINGREVTSRAKELAQETAARENKSI